MSATDMSKLAEDFAEDSAELKRLTELLVKVINSRDFKFQDPEGKELLRHVASDFEGRFDSHPHTISFKEQIEILQQNALDHPALQYTVLGMTTEMHRRSDIATVYLTLALTGVSDMQFQGYTELTWQYYDKRWWLCHHLTMRGPLLDNLMA